MKGRLRRRVGGRPPRRLICCRTGNRLFNPVSIAESGAADTP
jgi:hypothetical protein